MILTILRLHFFFSEYLKVHNYAYLHQCTFQEIIPQLREIYCTTDANYSSLKVSEFLVWEFA